MDIIATNPSVIYEVLTTRGEKFLIDNPAHLPDPSVIARNSRADCKGVRALPERKHR